MLSENPPPNSNAECVGPQNDQAGSADGCAGCPNQKACASGAGKKEDPVAGFVGDKLALVKHKILVLSGKGGVGKSTSACQIAFTLAAQGNQVGLLDVDICGPSVPRMTGLVGREVHQSGSGWTPIMVDLPIDGDDAGELLVMSVGFMLPNSDDAIIWRGPRKNGLIKQFLTDVDWGSLDYLIIDTPPGTSDEHLSIIQYLRGSGIDGAVIVTTPQEVAMADVRKEINFCKKTNVNVLGIIENMAGYSSPFQAVKFRDSSGEDVTEKTVRLLEEVAPQVLELLVQTDVFPAFGDGPEGMARRFEVPFLGSMPLDSNMLAACENGTSFIQAYPTSACAMPLTAIVKNLLEQVTAQNQPHKRASASSIA